jgi:dihydroorotate dehydrogenase electron transfer subunit
VLVAGGVGLPPLLAWHVRYGRPGDKAFFGARDPGDVPWPLLPPGWQVSVDRMGANGAGARAAPAGDGGADGRPPLHVGTVTACCALALPGAPSAGASVEPQGTTLYACGPLPMLRAAAALAVERGWRCLVSVEEHMGCGYGVCRGCVVPAGGGGHLTACQDGPVLSAEAIDWARFGRRETPPAPVAGGVGSQGAAASGAPSPGSGGGT